MKAGKHHTRESPCANLQMRIVRTGLVVVLSAAWTAGAAEVRYFSNDGDDAADGLTPKTAWRTLEKLGRDLPAGGDANKFIGQLGASGASGSDPVGGVRVVE